MKKRIFSRVLALVMALALLSTTALADVSFDDLQEAIDGNGEAESTTIVEDANKVPQPETPDTPEVPEDPEDPETPAGQETPAAPEREAGEDETHKNGALVRTENDVNYYGYGWSWTGEETNKTWYYAIEAHTANGERVVLLLDDVSKGNGEASGVVIGEDGSSTNVTIDMNDHSINGDNTGAVITVKEDATLNLNNGTVSGGEIGINVFGSLILDSVTVNGNTKNIAGTGKVTFKLDDREYQVDAKTADTLLAGKDSIAAHGDNWILAKNGENAYTVVYTGDGTVNSDGTKQLTHEDVTNVFNAFKSDTINQENVTGFILSGEVTSIGTRAFSRFPNLEEVQFNGNITSIGDYAFDRHPNLKSVNIPDSVMAIGNAAFIDCKSLTGDLKLPKSLTTLGSSAFLNCKSLTGNIEIPAGVEEISKQAFQGCTGLTGIVFAAGSKCNSIGNRAFNNCESLSTVEIPENVTNIGNEAFWQCAELEKVQIEGNVTSIGEKAFANCSKLSSLTIPDTVTSIGMWAFSECAALAIELRLPDGLTSLGKGAFAGCANLTGNVTIPAGVTEISEKTFQACENLQSIVFSADSKCENIGNKAFYKCGNLKTITIPASVTQLGDRAFDKTGLTSIFISPSEEKDRAEAAELIAGKSDVNIYIKDDAENLSFYRGNVSADFGHYSADNDVKLEDGSVALTNVIGTITTDKGSVNLDVPGTTASIDTNGNIIVNVPDAITVNGEEYPNGAIVTINPDGTISARPVEMPNFSFNFDTMGTGTGDNATTIADDEIPLAGLVTLAQLLDVLREHEGIEDVELPEDFQWADHEYAQAINWGLEEALVVDTGDDPLDPDEIVTVAILREVMTNYAAYLDTTFDVEIEGEDDMIVMNCDEILAEFYASLEDEAA